MDLQRPVLLPALAGWLAGVALLQALDLGGQVPGPGELPACAPLELARPAGAWPWVPTARELRVLPGLGRLRAVQVEEALWAAGLDPRRPPRGGLGPQLEAVPGIGPVSAGTVARWTQGLARDRLAGQGVHFEAATWPSPSPAP